MTTKSHLLRAIIMGFGASSIFFMLVALPTLSLDAIGKVQFLPKFWSVLWQIYLWPATLLKDSEVLNRALMLSSPDPRIALIPTFVANLILWGLLMSAVMLAAMRWRNET